MKLLKLIGRIFIGLLLWAGFGLCHMLLCLFGSGYPEQWTFIVGGAIGFMLIVPMAILDK